MSTIVELSTPSPLPEAGLRLEAHNHLGHYAQKQQVAGGCRPPAAWGSPVGPRGLVGGAGLTVKTPVVCDATPGELILKLISTRR